MASKNAQNSLPQDRIDELINILHNRFDQYPDRHKKVKWEEYRSRLIQNPDKLAIVNEMEDTGGEPDVIGIDPKSKGLIIVDCAPESPKGRRSLCYDPEALISRKEHKPKHSAIELAEEMGVSLLTEDEYMTLQKIGEFDLKTSTWLITPEDVRSKGGAIFGDRRYDRVFIYHNGAESYYAARGFRGKIII